MASSLTADEKNAEMSQERAFLTQLFQAALDGDFATLQDLVQTYCRQHDDDVTPTDVLTQFKDGSKRTALHFACQSPAHHHNDDDQPDIVEQMLSNDWLPDSSVQTMIRLKDKDGLTPIMIAAQLNDAELAQKRVHTLLQVSQKDDTTTSTSSSSSSSKLGLARSHAGATALHYAAGAGATADTIQELYDNGHVALETFSKQGGAPLHWACAVAPPLDYSTSTIRALLDCGADLNASRNGISIPPPLVMAMAAGNDKHAKFLLEQAMERKIDLQPTLDFCLPGGLTVFHMAADLNMVGVLSLLLQVVASKEEDKKTVTKQSDEGLTPLDMAAREGNVGCVLLLLPYGDGGEQDNPTEDDALKYIERWKEEHADSKTAATSPPIDKPTSTTSDEAIDEERQAKEQAEAILASADSISDEDKSKAQALKVQGNVRYGNKEYQQALECYTEAIQADPTDATFYSNRSACNMALHHPKEALSDAMIARTLRPEWSRAAYRMAVARLELGRYEDAAVAAWEGLQLDQDNDELNSLLQKCVKKGRQEFHSKKSNSSTE